MAISKNLPDFKGKIRIIVFININYLTIFYIN